jgi:hypothetical protein
MDFCFFFFASFATSQGLPLLEELASLVSIEATFL